MRAPRWLTVWFAVLLGLPVEAQPVVPLIYAAVPGVGNDVQVGGAGILVFDRNQGHKLLRRIPTLPTYTREAPEPIKGIAASVGSGLLYVSTTRGLAAFDLKTDRLVWQSGYDADCCDRMAVSPDGKVLYVPSLGTPKWYVVDAHTGAVITTVVKDGAAHNTIYSPSGERVYLASLARRSSPSSIRAPTASFGRSAPSVSRSVPLPLTARRRSPMSASTICSGLGSAIC